MEKGTKDEKAKATTMRFGKPSWCFEQSRNQVLCRTGLRGKGQSEYFKFGGDSGRTEEEAQVLAENRVAEWVKARIYT